MKELIRFIALKVWPAVMLAAAVWLAPDQAAAQQGRGFDQDAPGQPPSSRREQRPEAGRSSPKDGKSAEKAPPKPIPKSMRPPGGSAVPQSGAERAKLLDELYAHLATAENEDVANRVATAIEHVWQAYGSDTVNLLMERARRAASEKKPELAINLLDRAALLAPDFAEVFNRRASVHYALNNARASIGDLRRVLALEPNHFKALEALGQILKEMENKKAALEVYRKLYQVHPHMSGAKSTFEELEREVKGQES